MASSDLICILLVKVTFCDFRYESGDHVAVFPTNDSALVNKLGQILGVDLDVVISLNNLDGTALKAQRTLTLLASLSKVSRNSPMISTAHISSPFTKEVGVISLQSHLIASGIDFWHELD